MINFSSCFSVVNSPTLYTTLPHSPKWKIENYKNSDCQPDEEFSEEKRIDFHKDLLNLINYPINKYIIKKYENHPQGPIYTYLEWHVLIKRSRL